MQGRECGERPLAGRAAPLEVAVLDMARSYTNADGTPDGYAVSTLGTASGVSIGITKT